MPIFYQFKTLCLPNMVNFNSVVFIYRGECGSVDLRFQFMEFSFEQNAQGNRPQVHILGEEVERVTHFK